MWCKMVERGSNKVVLVNFEKVQYLEQHEQGSTKIVMEGENLNHVLHVKESINDIQAYLDKQKGV